MPQSESNALRLNLVLIAAIAVLAIVSLMVGPAGLSPREALAGLFGGDGAAAIIVRDIRLPRTLLAILIGGTFGFAGAALQGLLRNPLAEPALFGAPRAASVGASFVIAMASLARPRSRCRSPASSARWFRSADWSRSPDAAPACR